MSVKPGHTQHVCICVHCCSARMPPVTACLDADWLNLFATALSHASTQGNTAAIKRSERACLTVLMQSEFRLYSAHATLTLQLLDLQ